MKKVDADAIVLLSSNVFIVTRFCTVILITFRFDSIKIGKIVTETLSKANWG